MIQSLSFPPPLRSVRDAPRGSHAPLRCFPPSLPPLVRPHLASFFLFAGKVSIPFFFLPPRPFCRPLRKKFPKSSSCIIRQMARPLQSSPSHRLQYCTHAGKKRQALMAQKRGREVLERPPSPFFLRAPDPDRSHPAALRLLHQSQP